MLKRRKKIKICFICSGNVFRSYSAELLTRKYLVDNNINNLEVDSFGIIPGFLPLKYTLDKLKTLGVKPSRRYGNMITKKKLEKQDLIICMTKSHQEFVKNLGFDSELYNVVAYNKKEDLLDEHEFGLIHGFDFDIKKYINDTVDYINKATPLIVKNFESFFN